MKTLVVGQGGTTAPAASISRRNERLFYTGMSLAIAITVFAGFARTYYLRPFWLTFANWLTQ